MLVKYLSKKKIQRTQWRIFNRMQTFMRKGVLLFMELCGLGHLTYPFCDFIPLIYKMGTNYTPWTIAEKIKWRHCEKVLVSV